MSGADLLAPDLAPEPVKKTAPPRRWRNRWWRERSFVSIGEIFHPAGVHFGTRVFASEDVAESHALRWLDEWGEKYPCEYLGAFPVDEDAP